MTPVALILVPLTLKGPNNVIFPPEHVKEVNLLRPYAGSPRPPGISEEGF
jgi:hypothetical protein